MSYCLLCETNYKPRIDFKELFLIKKVHEPVICPVCFKKFEKISNNFCKICHREMKIKEICEDCKQWGKKYQNNLLINQSCFKYNLAFHDLMVSYKRYGDYILRKVLAELVYGKIPPADYYVPIPTSLAHQTKRKYDTISEIFSPLVSLTPLLTKVDTLEAQGEKNRQERMLTKQSFKAVKGAKVGGKVLLLDDIYTTGRTLYHAKDALVKEYPKLKITSFTIAR